MSLAEIAAEYGLRDANRRAGLREYLRDTWQRRDFIRELAYARSAAFYADTILGRIWQLLTPLLNAAIYYFIFGLLLGTKKGVPNFIGFLIAGVFAFNFMQSAITAAASVLSRNRKLTEAILFPRLVLPVSTLLQQVQQYGISLAVLVVVELATGEPLTWAWLLLGPVVLMQTMFILGAALIVARWGSRTADISQVLPFVLRAWRYVSGVFFSITAFTSHLDSWIGRALQLNPGAVYLDILRDSLMTSQSADATVWYMAVVWALLFLGFGLVYFHRGEVQRD